MLRMCGATSLLLLFFLMADVSFCLFREFVLYTEKTTWNDAYLKCEQDGGQLLKLYSKEEDFVLKGLMGNEPQDDIWIGLNTDDEIGRTESDFKFADCQPLSWSNWESGFTQENGKQCVLIKKNERRWYREACSKDSNFICDIPTGECTYETQSRTCPTAAVDKEILNNIASTKEDCKHLCETKILNGKKCYAYQFSNWCVLHHSSDPYFCETSYGNTVMNLRRCYSFRVSSKGVPVTYWSDKPEVRTCTSYDPTTTTSTTTSVPTTSSATTTTVTSTTTQPTTSSAVTTTQPVTTSTTTTTFQSTTSNTTDQTTTQSTNSTTLTTTTAKPLTSTEKVSNTSSTTSPTTTTSTSTSSDATTNESTAVLESETTKTTTAGSSTTTQSQNTEYRTTNDTSDRPTTSPTTIMATSTSSEATTDESTTVLESESTTTDGSTTTTQSQTTDDTSTTNSSTTTTTATAATTYESTTTAGSSTTTQSQTTEYSTTGTTGGTRSQNTLPWTIRTTSEAGNSEVCVCDICGKRNMTIIEENMKQVRNDLKVKKAELSSTRRKKECAIDDRPSAQKIGYIGIMFFVVLLGSIILSDIRKIYFDMKTLR